MGCTAPVTGKPGAGSVQDAVPVAGVVPVTVITTPVQAGMMAALLSVKETVLVRVPLNPEDTLAW